jgi:hypothetical protein
MSSHVVLWSVVRAMLDHCAGGWTDKIYTHNRFIFFNGKTFNRIPLGEHGRRKDVENELGHVRQMVRQLGIDETCAKSQISLLKF